MIRVTTIRETLGTAQDGVGRAFEFSSSRTTFLQRLAFGVLAVAGALLVLAVIIPVVIFLIAFAIVAGVLGYLWLKIRVWFVRAKQPNGALDGRRNVRVREPDLDNPTGSSL